MRAHSPNMAASRTAPCLLEPACVLCVALRRLFAGTQFLVEGLASACTLWAALTRRANLGMQPPNDAERALLAFILSILAVFVPMTQVRLARSNRRACWCAAPLCPLPHRCC